MADTFLAREDTRGERSQALGGPPPLFQTVVWAPEEDRPGLSGVRRPSSASVLLLEKERVADPAPAPA